MIKFSAGTIVALILLALTQSESQSPPFLSAILELKVAEEEASRKTESRSKVWIDYEGQRYCSETKVVSPDGKGATFVTIQSHGNVYMLNVANRTAQEIPASDEQQMVFDWDRLPDYKRFGGIVVGTDTVAGYETDVYEYIQFEDTMENLSAGEKSVASRDKEMGELKSILARSASQSRVRAWIWRDTDVPLKTVVDYGPKQITSETIQISVNVAIPERVFTIPEDYTMKRMQR